MSLIHVLAIISSLASVSVGAMLALMLFSHGLKRDVDYGHRQEECHYDEREEGKSMADAIFKAWMLDLALSRYQTGRYRSLSKMCSRHRPQCFLISGHL